MTNPLWVGGTAILDARRPTPQTVAEIFRRFSPSIFAGVPTFYAALLKTGAMTNSDVTSSAAMLVRRRSNAARNSTSLA